MLTSDRLRRVPSVGEANVGHRRPDELLTALAAQHEIRPLWRAHEGGDPVGRGKRSGSHDAPTAIRWAR